MRTASHSPPMLPFPRTFWSLLEMERARPKFFGGSTEIMEVRQPKLPWSSSGATTALCGSREHNRSPNHTASNLDRCPITELKAPRMALLALLSTIPQQNEMLYSKTDKTLSTHLHVLPTSQHASAHSSGSVRVTCILK